MKIIIYRDKNEGLLSYNRSSDGKSFPLQIIGDVIKIREQFTEIVNMTDYEVVPLLTTDGIPTYQIFKKASILAGGQGKRGIQGETGPAGPAGPIGPTGPEGAPPPPVAVRVYQTATQSIPSNTNPNIIFDSVNFDDAGADAMFDIAFPTRLTCRKAGKYIIQGSVNYAEAGDSLNIITVQLNSLSNIANITTQYNDATYAVGVDVNTIWDLSVDDFIELNIVNPTLVNHNTNPSVSTVWFSMARQ